MNPTRLPLLPALALACLAGIVQADEIRVAVASNFSKTAKVLADKFEKKSGHTVTLAFGSTGKHYAQIHHGAPFHAFLAADTKRPQLLEKNHTAISGSRFTYAIGKLILWSPKPGLVDTKGNILTSGTFRHIAIANPKLAPYGKAAEEIIKARGVLAQLRTRTVRGENIGQAYQFVHSGNAELGFVAYSQIVRPDGTIPGSHWQPPTSLYPPIVQQAVLLKNNQAAREFLAFIKSPETRKIIQAHGYDTP